MKTDGGTLSWQPNAEPDFCYYRVFRGTTPNFTPSLDTQIASTIATTFADTTRIAGAAYYKVIAVDQSGNARGRVGVAGGGSDVALAGFSGRESRVAFAIDAGVPVVIRCGRRLGFHRLQPRVLARRLVAVGMDDDVMH